MKKLGLDIVIGSKRSRERDLVNAMIAERLIHPSSKLATTRLWHTTTLAEELAVTDTDKHELHGALDWLLAREEEHSAPFRELGCFLECLLQQICHNSPRMKQ
jgi:hypothetical protein